MTTFQDYATKAEYANAATYARTLFDRGDLNGAERIVRRLRASRFHYSRQQSTKQAAQPSIIRDVQTLLSSATNNTARLPSWVKSMSQSEADLVLFAKGWPVKALQTGAQDSSYGFTVPEDIAARVMARTRQESVVRPRASLYQATTDLMTVLTVGNGATGSDQYPSNIRAQFVADGQSTQAGQALQIGATKAPINRMSFFLPVSKSLLEDADPNLVLDTIINEGGKSIANGEDRAFLVGSGVNEPLGVLATQASGQLLNGDIRITSTGSNSAILGDSVVASLYALPAAVRDAPGFAACASSATMASIRTLKDSTGNFVFNGDTRRLCGYPVAESEHAPAIAADAFPLLWGDFSGYQISDRTELLIQRYDDQRTADLDQVWFYFRKRLGGTTAIGSRFSALRVRV